MSKVARAFANGKAFIAYVTAGDPDLGVTEALVREMAAAGADLIEIGIPFSDPTAEGPVIQAAIERSLAAGCTTDKVFEMTARLAAEVDVPLVYMTYANVVYGYGVERFAARAAASGAAGIILPDVPFEEKLEFAPAFGKAGMDFISLVAPTSEERIAMIAREAEGFLYIVSSLGVTGVRSSITTDVGAMAALARAANPQLPTAIGFGISTPEQARAMGRHADGVIVGSAIVKQVAALGADAPAAVGAYVKGMKAALAGL